MSDVAGGELGRIMTESITEEEPVGYHGENQNQPILEQSSLDTDHAMITDLLKTKQWLENQLIELKTELNAAENSGSPDADERDPEILHTEIFALQSELQDTCVAATLRSFMLSRIQNSVTLSKKVFSEPDEDDQTEAEEQHKHQQELLAALCLKQATLTREILQFVQENEEKLSKLNELRAANLDLKQTVQSLMSELMNAKDHFKTAVVGADDALLTAKESLTMAEQKVDILRHLLQSLIFGSGINWAEDDAVRKLVLDLGQPLDEHQLEVSEY